MKLKASLVIGSLSTCAIVFVIRATDRQRQLAASEVAESERQASNAPDGEWITPSSSPFSFIGAGIGLGIDQRPIVGQNQFRIEITGAGGEDIKGIPVKVSACDCDVVTEPTLAEDGFYYVTLQFPSAGQRHVKLGLARQDGHIWLEQDFRVAVF